MAKYDSDHNSDDDDHHHHPERGGESPCMCTCLCLFAISDSIHEGTVIRYLQWAAAGDIQADCCICIT